METMEAIKARRSIRQFQEKEVSDELIREILEAGRLAPSGVNCQPWRFVVVKSEEMRQKIGGATPMPFVPTAPVIIVCCIDMEAVEKGQVMNRARELLDAGVFDGTPMENFDPETYADMTKMDKEYAKSYLSLNGAIAIQNMNLRAADLGLGTCWVMMFSRRKIREMLELEDRYDVISLLPVGYPQHNPPPRPRLSLEEILLKEV